MTKHETLILAAIHCNVPHDPWKTDRENIERRINYAKLIMEELWSGSLLAACADLPPDTTSDELTDQARRGMMELLKKQMKSTEPTIGNEEKTHQNTKCSYCGEEDCCKYK